MSQTDQKPEGPDNKTADDEACIKGVSPLEAAATAVAQSIAFSAQNEVDGSRNQNTIGMVVVGSAYAKWLQNPGMGAEFNRIIGNVRSGKQASDSLDKYEISQGSDLLTNDLARNIFSQYFINPK